MTERLPRKPVPDAVKVLRLQTRNKNLKERAAKREAELLQGIEMASGLARHNSERRAEAEAKLKHVLALLPEGSVCASPMVEELRRMPHPAVPWSVDVSPPLPPYSPLDALGLDEKSTFTVEQLEQIIVAAFPDGVDDRLHMTLKVGDYPDCEVRYVLGRKAIRDMKAPQLDALLHQQIFPQMTEALVKAMKVRFA